MVDSERFTVRLSPVIKRWLAGQAKRHNRTLSAEIETILAWQRTFEASEKRSS